MDEGFWENPNLWPIDPHEYVFLARAFKEIARAKFGPEWSLTEVESEVQREQDPSEDDPVEDDWELNLEKMQAEVQREIANQCLAGILVTAVRRLAGGKMTPLEPSHWNTENYSGRFYRCQMSLTDLFPKRNIIGSHWIYVTRESLNQYLQGIAKIGQPIAAARAAKMLAAQEAILALWGKKGPGSSLTAKDRDRQINGWLKKKDKSPVKESTIRRALKALRKPSCPT